jgi:hypothetical protein
MNLAILLFSLFVAVVMGKEYAPAPEPMSIEDLSDAAPVYGGEDVFGVYGKFR